MDPADDLRRSHTHQEIKCCSKTSPDCLSLIICLLSVCLLLRGFPKSLLACIERITPAEEVCSSDQGRNWGKGVGGRAPPPAFQTLAKEMCLKIEAQHIFNLAILPIIIITGPPSQNYPVAPLLQIAISGQNY